MIYLPEGKQVQVDLSPYRVPFRVRWLDPSQGGRTRAEDVQGGEQVTLTSPWDAGDAVLVLRRLSR